MYAARGWVSLPADGVRLLSRDYVEAIQLWISQIPAATQTQLPPDFLSEYFEEITVKLRRVWSIDQLAFSHAECLRLSAGDTVERKVGRGVPFPNGRCSKTEGD